MMLSDLTHWCTPPKQKNEAEDIEPLNQIHDVRTINRSPLCE